MPLLEASFQPPHPDGQEEEEEKDAPSWVAVDVQAYISNRKNATTAYAKTRDGEHEIQVTFCVARPPRVSHICVYSPDFPNADTVFLIEPQLVATEGSLALLYFSIGHPSETYDDPDAQHYYIYNASDFHRGGSPSLLLLPPFPCRSWPCCVFHGQISLLPRLPSTSHSYSDGYLYTVAALTPSEHGPFDLLLLHSGDNAWTCKTIGMEAPLQLPPSGWGLNIDSTITVGGEGGGTMAFVDLRNGMLLGDVLLHDPVLRFIPLPPSLKHGREQLEHASDHRDMAYVGGQLKYVELQTTTHHTDNQIPDGWAAATWTWDSTATSSDENWIPDCQIQAGDITVDKNPVQFELLSRLQSAEGGTPQSDLARLYMGQPKISLQHDNVVHFMTMAQYASNKAQVIAVDMRNKVLQGVADFGAERISSIAHVCAHSKISACLPSGKLCAR